MKHLDYGQNCNSKKQRHMIIPHKERGVVAIIVALSMVVLVGFVGLALDLGKLFVTKTELQNSADACALAAARELAGANNNQLVLAEAAGIAAGTSNNVMFQGDAVSVVGSDVTFSETLNGSYLAKEGVANALDMRFVRCTVDRTDIPNWFMQVLGIGDQDVNATAVASLAPSQNFSCAIPVGICDTAIDEDSAGKWLQGTVSPGGSVTGSFGWVDFTPPNGGANELNDILAGQCGAVDIPATGSEVGQTGFVASLSKAWNSRFGIYHGDVKKPSAKGDPGTPDRTGYAYYPGLDGVPTVPDLNEPYNKFSDYVDKTTNYESYQGNTFLGGVIPPLDPPLDPQGGNNHLSGGSASSEHGILGIDNRRVGIVAVTSGDCPGGPKLEYWACVLMLHPIVIGGGDRPMWIEYIGKATDENSPCATIGIPGGKDSTGPKVPTLVQ